MPKGIRLMVVALALLCAGTAARAQDYIRIGPRSIYGTPNIPDLPNTDTRSGANNQPIPLVMRDAIQYLVTGRRLIDPTSRIMGGQPAPQGAYPWIASIQVKHGSKDGHFCGGAFIAPQWVVTAAHCMEKEIASQIQVLGGTNNLGEGGTVYFVDRIIIHERWDSTELNWDVALLHLEKNFTGKTVRLVSPADKAKFAGPGALAVVAGWGLTAEGGAVSNVLRHVTVQLVSNTVCNGLGSYSGGITDQMICAGFPEGGRDACQGDSGGPLVAADGMGGYLQIGIVSFGDGCGRPNKYGVYTNVAVIEPWVMSKISGQSSAPMAFAPQKAKHGSLRSLRKTKQLLRSQTSYRMRPRF